MINSTSTTAPITTIPQQVSSVSSDSEKTRPENGLATIAQQPDTYTLANKTLQFGLHKIQTQHTQNLINAYTQNVDAESSQLITNRSVTELYKLAYILERGDFPIIPEEEKTPKLSDEYMTIEPMRSSQLSAYENNQPKVNSLLEITV